MTWLLAVTWLLARYPITTTLTAGGLYLSWLVHTSFG